MLYMQVTIYRSGHTRCRLFNYKTRVSTQFIDKTYIQMHLALYKINEYLTLISDALTEVVLANSQSVNISASQLRHK